MNKKAILFILILFFVIGCFLITKNQISSVNISNKRYNMEVIDTFSVYHSNACVPIFVSTIKRVFYEGQLKHSANKNTAMEFDFLNLRIESHYDTIIELIDNSSGNILLCIPVLSEKQQVYIFYGLIPFKLSDYLLQDSVYTIVCDGLYLVEVYKLCIKDTTNNNCLGFSDGKVNINELFYLYYRVDISSLPETSNSSVSKTRKFCLSDNIISITSLVVTSQLDYSKHDN